MGSVPWTPQLSHTMKYIRWCKLSLAKLKGRKISSRTLQRLKASIQATTDHTSEQSLRAELRAQRKKFSLLSKTAEADRLQWLSRLADQYQQHGLMTKHKAIIALQKREEARTTARRIKAVQHKLQSKGISFVSVPSSDGRSWRDISAKHMVEKTILEVNMAKYSQARSTPFLVEPLASKVGPLGLASGADKSFKGPFKYLLKLHTPPDE